MESYLQKLVDNTRLNGLMGKHRELSNQIKTLDSQMQQLVYENYNKFITATDEVRSVPPRTFLLGAPIPSAPPFLCRSK